MKDLILYVEHPCGCVTEGDDNEIYFQKTCLTHQQHGVYIFIGMAHKEMYKMKYGGDEVGKKKTKAIFRRLDV